MIDADVSIHELQERLDRRLDRARRLREQGLLELAECEERAAEPERVALASALAELPAPNAPASSAASGHPGCSRCADARWVWDSCCSAPCPICNPDGALPCAAP